MNTRKRILLIFIMFFIMQFILLNNVNAYSAETFKTIIQSSLLPRENAYFDVSDRADYHFHCPDGFGAYQCYAFARYAQHQFFGTCDHCGGLSQLFSSSINSIDDLRVGDVVRYCSGKTNHSILIIDVIDSNTIIVMDSNRDNDNKVHKNTLNFSNIKGYLGTTLLYTDAWGNYLGESGSAYVWRAPGNEVKSITNTLNGDVAIDSVTAGKIYTSGSTMTVQGWATSNTDEGLQILIDGKAVLVNEFIERYERDDIKQEKAGYRADIDLSSFSTGYHTLRVYVYEKNTHKAITAKDIHFYIVEDAGMPDEFSARIVHNANNNYVIGIALKPYSSDADSTNVELERKNLNDSSQIWNFKKVSGTYMYEIVNKGNGKYIHIIGSSTNDGTNVITYRYSDDTSEKFYLTKYNGGIRIVPQCAQGLQALDLVDNTLAAGTNIQIYQNKDKTDVAAQTWKLEKVATSITISLNSTSSSIPVGESKTLFATVYPTDAANRSVTWSSSNTSIATVSSTGVVKGIKAGTVKITATANDGSGVSKTCTITIINPALVKEPSVSYRSHVQNIGWENSWKYNGGLSGTVGKCLRLEGLQVCLHDKPYAGTIQYRSHVQTVGWESVWKTDSQVSGSVGKSLRVEAIQIKLTDEMAKHYDIYYRLQIQDYGWLGWAKNGQSAGSEGHSKKVEAIEIKLVEKGGKAPGSTDRRFVRASGLKYRSHVQNIGWMPYVDEKGLSGTSGRGLRVEAFQLKLTTTQYDGGIRYRGNIQNNGWESWKYDKQESGTNGKSLRMEAFQIELYGDVANYYDVYYRVHVQNIGWMGWAKNGQSAGTSGYGYRIESFQIQLVDKGGQAPGSTADAFRSK